MVHSGLGIHARPDAPLIIIFLLSVPSILTMAVMKKTQGRKIAFKAAVIFMTMTVTPSIYLILATTNGIFYDGHNPFSSISNFRNVNVVSKNKKAINNTLGDWQKIGETKRTDSITYFFGGHKTLYKTVKLTFNNSDGDEVACNFDTHRDIQTSLLGCSMYTLSNIIKKDIVDRYDVTIAPNRDKELETYGYWQPSYDPELSSGRLPSAVWVELLDAPHHRGGGTLSSVASNEAFWPRNISIKNVAGSSLLSNLDIRLHVNSIIPPSGLKGLGDHISSYRFSNAYVHIEVKDSEHNRGRNSLYEVYLWYSDGNLVKSKYSLHSESRGEGYSQRAHYHFDSSIYCGAKEDSANTYICNEDDFWKLDFTQIE